MNRAAKGGQIGVNNEHYKGGRFLPSNPDRAKVECSKPRKARKIEIEPFVWIEAPAGFVSIFSFVSGLYPYDRATNKFDVDGLNDRQIAHLGAALPRYEAWAHAYNRGERITIQPTE